jgi:uncharacterized cupredoxin-like copper-binding protein
MRLVPAAVAGAALLSLAGPTACGGGARAAGPDTIVLTIHHSHFSASTLHVRPGATVRFVVRNTDPIEHELIVGDAATQEQHEVGTDALHNAPGAVSVPAGTTRATTYTFPATGPLLFGCHLPGHWAFGMRGTIVIGSTR